MESEHDRIVNNQVTDAEEANEKSSRLEELIDRDEKIDETYDD